MEKEKKITKKCKNCGGNLEFSPLFQSLYCENCKTTEDVDFNNQFSKHIVNNDEFNNFSNASDWKTNVYNCINCGARVINDELSYSKECPYCSSPIVVSNQTGNVLMPDSVVPFTIDKSKVFETYRKNIKRKWFLPNAFKKNPPMSNIKGIYIPAFGFDANTVNTYDGVLSDTKTNSEGKSVTYTKHISGTKAINFTDNLVETSSHLNQQMLNSVKPYDIGKAVKFNDDFIRGFSVQHFEDSILKCYNISKEIMKQDIRNQILSKYTYTSVVRLNISSSYSNEKFCYYLLPAYKINFEYKKNQYTTFMNGQTGKVGDGLPQSKVKKCLFISGIIAILIAIILLCTIFGD